MLKKAMILAFMLLAAVLQASFLPAIFGNGTVPDLALAAAVIWVMDRGFEKAFPSVIAFSVIMDIFRSQPIGTEAVSLSLIAFGASSFSKRFLFSQGLAKVLSVMLIVFGATLADRLIVLTLSSAACRIGSRQCYSDFGWPFWIDGFRQGAANVAMAAVIYLPLRKLEALLDMYEYKRVIPR